MITKSYKELFEKGKEFVSYLQSQGLSAVLDLESFRDYHVKIRNVFGETITLYHKPSKKTFSIQIKDSIPEDIREQIFLFWTLSNSEELFPDIGLSVYVDGSFYNNLVGWGMVVIENRQILYKDKGIVDLPYATESRQISGEIQAVLEALKYAEMHKKAEITIYYDYLGLEKWAKKMWSAHSKIAQYYLHSLSQTNVRIHWKKVQAHSGDIYNDMADKLAKSAIETAY